MRSTLLLLTLPLYFLLAWLAVPSQSAAVSFGMVGDSLTDDYLGGPAQINNDLAALSWGQILGAARAPDFDFGGYRPVGSTWDNTVRYSGYEYNFATSGGAASDNAVLNITGFNNPLPVTISGTSTLSTQTAGLAPLIAGGNVSTAFVGIGSNDFFYHTNTFAFDGSFAPNPNAVIDQVFINDVAGSILAGVDTLIAAGPVDIMLGLIPSGTAGGTSPAIDAGISAVNQILIQGAASRGVPIVDLFGWASDPTRVDQNGSVLIGNLVIGQGTVATAADLSTSGLGTCNSLGQCATATHANNFIAEDQIHPNTIIQGLIANQIIAALNTNYGHGIQPLSDNEILGLAAVPEPGTGLLLGFGLTLLGTGSPRSRRFVAQ